MSTIDNGHLEVGDGGEEGAEKARGLTQITSILHDSRVVEGAIL